MPDMALLLLLLLLLLLMMMMMMMMMMMTTTTTTKRRMRRTQAFSKYAWSTMSGMGRDPFWPASIFHITHAERNSMLCQS
jgi:hypothetical protein